MVLNQLKNKIMENLKEMKGIAQLNQSLIKEIDGEKFVRCNIFYNKEDGFYYPVIDPSGKTYIDLKICVDLSDTITR